MDVNSQKCLGCGATLKYNPELEKWKCEYCKAEYTISDIEKMQEKDDEVTVSKENINYNEGIASNKDMKLYVCPNCGAELITDDNTVATSCVYCKSTAIINKRISGVLFPQYLIPFSKSKNDAINGFKSCLKGKLFAPKDFSDEKNINEITGVYVPFWLFDSNVNASLDAKATKVTSWVSGDMHYTKTDTYLVTRDGTMRFEKVPTDSSTKFQDELMDSIEPYTYEKLQKFNEAYLSGFLAEKYDVSKEEASLRMEKRVSETSINELLKTANGYTSVSPTRRQVNIEKGNISYVMLPVWMLNIKYKNKIHHFAMNGETGKLIGDIPMSKSKAFLYTLIFFVITFVVIYLLRYFYISIKY